jgi:hypothetical protein
MNGLNCVRAEAGPFYERLTMCGRRGVILVAKVPSVGRKMSRRSESKAGKTAAAATTTP